MAKPRIPATGGALEVTLYWAQWRWSEGSVGGRAPVHFRILADTAGQKAHVGLIECDRLPAQTRSERRLMLDLLRRHVEHLAGKSVSHFGPDLLVERLQEQ